MYMYTYMYDHVHVCILVYECVCVSAFVGSHSMSQRPQDQHHKDTIKLHINLRLN